MDIGYTLIMLAAVVAGGALLRRSQRGLPLPWQDRAVIGVAAFCGAMLGARLPFLLWDAADGSFVWLANGKTILAGLVGGYLAVEAVKATLGVKVKTGDSFAAPVAVAVAIGRLGCFHAGCCYGAPTDRAWGVVFPLVDSSPRHPTQLYEAAFHFLAAAVLWRLQARGVFPRQLLKLYILAYAVYRFGTEWLRPEPEFFAGLTAYQWGSLLVIALFAWLWRRDARAVTAIETT